MPTPTPTETGGGEALAVLAGDVLVLRGAGLAAPETWALLCQAAQALQDLFLSNGGVVGGSGMGPVVTPHTLELTPRGRVTLRSAPPETARAYLPPEYRPGRTYSDTDSEKMWMYSLGRALLDTTPRGAALTGTGSVSPSSALQSVLAAMTEPDPHRRASLMNLLDVISEYCRTRLQTKPFSHIVMDMYREVVRCPQYAARKRTALQGARAKPHQPRPAQQQTQPLQPHFPKHHHGKGASFKTQSRNSRSQPNLLSLSGCEGLPMENGTRPEFQSQINIPGNQGALMTRVHHGRTNSQPAYNDRCNYGYETVSGSGSSSNLLAISTSQNMQSSGNIYSDPIYSLPVKPFLSTQDVRHNGLPANIKTGTRPLNNHSQSVDVHGGITNRVAGESHTVRVCRTKHPSQGLLYHRQASNPQLRARTNETNPNTKRCSVPAQLSLYAAQCDPVISNCQTQHPADCGDGKNGNIYGQISTQGDILQQISSSGKAFVPRGPVPPKPPRIITTLKRTAPTSGPDNESGPPVKPPRSAIKCGPRARRGKAVQRAPSRLYRAVGGPSRSLNKTRCVGPEFVVRANQQPKQLVVGDLKTASTSRVVVILLTGQRLEVACDPQKITAGELFQAVVQAENLEENFTLGLAALLAGDFAILPPDTKLNKVAPPGWLNTGKSKGLLGLPTSFMLYFRLRFFLPSLRGIRSWCSKHLLYLQLRRCILEQQLVCSLGQLISLTGLALQAEFGNYSSNEHGCGDYFLIEHYVPESLVLSREQVQSELSGSTEALRTQLHQAHRDRFGLDTNKAEEMFIAHSQSLSDYGAHYYIATLDTKELGKIVAQQMSAGTSGRDQRKTDGVYVEAENIYDVEKSSDDPIYGKIDFPGLGAGEEVLRIPYSDEQKVGMSEELYAVPRARSSKASSRPEPNNNISNNNKNNNNNNNNHCGISKTKKSNESGVWIAIHADGLKLFDRGGSPREKIELARFQWRDIQTLSYSKSCLVVHTKLNNKRCKFKLRMDHRKSYFAFKLTSLHHQFFLKFRAELTSLQGLAAEFGVPLMVEPNSPPPKLKPDSSKNKISIADATKKQQNQKFSMQLEEYQNKENENPQKKNQPTPQEPIRYTPEEDALYAQVHARLEPEGASRDTEDESDRGLISPQHHFTSDNVVQGKIDRDEEKLYAYAKIGPPDQNGYFNVLSKPLSSDDIDLLVRNPEKTEDIYAAINKAGQQPKKFNFPVPEEVWDVTDVTGVKKTSLQVKTSSLPNYGTPRQMTGFRSPSLPRRLGVKMGTRAIYSSLQRDPTLADVTSDLESLSLKSDTTSSVRSASADSPLPEAYVLNADIRSDDETFRVPVDETMSASLMARLDELSFAEERILHAIQLERGHGGSIGLQVTEGSDGGVYVQAVSVGGSADMAGNVNKGDRIVAINGQSLLNLRYEEALKMLQSSAETVDLVLSQILPRGSPRLDIADNRGRGPIENNYLQNIRFDMASELDATNAMASKWLGQKTHEVSSVQNTSSAYSSASSSAMGDPRPAPPVPPRRLKRKNKPLVGPTDGVVEAATTSVIRLEPRPRLPPPPPPQRVLPRRGIRPQLLPSQDVTGIISPANYSAENCHADSISGDKLLVSDVEGVQPTLSTFGTTGRLPLARGIGKKPSAEEPPRVKREKAKVPRPNEYPPLFFTLQDFQEVMSDVENSYSRTLKNMTTFEPTPKPRVSKISIKNLPETPEKSEVLFRVTTTNLPFEKSPTEWSDGGNDPNHFIFEDYVDRRQISAQRKSKMASTKLVLFGDDTFDRDDEDQTISTSHTASRVRFLVDFPTKDENYEKITELDSLQNIDSLPLDCPPSKDLMLEEKPSQDEQHEEYKGEDEDEFGDVPFDSLLNATNDSQSSLGVDPSEDSTSSKSDFQTILVTARVEPLPLVGEVKKPPEKSNVELLEEKVGPFREEEVISKDKYACDEPKSSCFEVADLVLDTKCETKGSPISEPFEERDEVIETIDRIGEKRRIVVDESLCDFMEVENYADKPPSENVRRNSFMMNMLQGDEPDERVVCKVVAAHPKTPIHGSRMDGFGKGGEPSAAVEAKSKLLGELSSSFSAIKLKPVNNFEEVEEKLSASDLKFDSMNVQGDKEEVQDPNDKYKDDDDDDDDEVDNDMKYKLNRNLDSVLNSNVVKCKVSEEPIEDESSKPRDEPQDRSNVCSQKTDEIIDKNYVENKNSVCEESEIEFAGDIDREKKIDPNNAKEMNNKNDDNYGNNLHSMMNIKKNINNNVVEVASRISVDKCAIVLKCNNNNDNNAMTPVDVSYDQSQNNVSIIPGSVRSFVKFYEIQGETSVGLNSNDTAAVPKIKVEATGNSLDNNCREMRNKNVILNPACFEIENDIKYTIVARKPVIKRQHNTVPTDLINIAIQHQDQSDKSSRSRSTENEAHSMSAKLCKFDGKRDAQSHTGSSLIRSTRIVQNEQEEAKTEQGGEPRSKLSASKKPDAVVSSTHNAASSRITSETQDGSTAGVIKDVVRSGTTNHSVPKSSTSTINEQYTFYCTV